MWKFIPILVCLAGPALADSDPWGNKYPAECSAAALADVHMPVVRVPQSFLDKATKTPGRFGVAMRTGVAAIRDDLTGDILAETIRHEKCHMVVGEWHG